MRKFERVKDEFLKYKVADIKLPVRATKNSAGYDFYSPIDLEIAPHTAEMVWTNVKACFNGDEVLMLAVTSGMGKNGIMLSNNVGIIDADYYSNVSNDGNVGFRLYNFLDKMYQIKAGDKIGQGLFFKYLTVDDEKEITTARIGGFGSTVKK
jgi:dUTP pyrophosphatase